MAGAVVAWVSNDTEVATVNASGLMMATGNGTTDVMATSETASGTVSVTVMQLANEVMVSPAANSLSIGDTLRLSAEAFDANGHAMAGATFAWSSSDPSVARVDGSGLVRGVAEGMADITAASGDAEGASGITVANSDRAVLVALYEATGGNSWTNSDNWLTEAPLNEWHGVETDHWGRVVGLQMAEWRSGVGWLGNNLTGGIPPALGNLSSLTDLNLNANALTGEIPPELGALSRLRTLDLDRNGLTGQIPPELGHLYRLRRLGLAHNRLTGGVPPEFGNLASLWSLALSYNTLTGSVPRSLLDVSSLALFGFSHNEGLCAPGTGDFASWLDGLEWYRGPFCNESDRVTLELLFETAGGSGWTRSDGWVATPALDEWYGVRTDSLGRVAVLDLGRNQLAGRLPGTLGNLLHMTEFRMDGNADLSGRLPSSLVGLSLLALHYNGTGLCVPAEDSFRTWLNAIPSHEGTGIECGALSDREILEAVYDATGGRDWTDSRNWLTEAPLGDWHGVRVDGRGRVVELSLPANNLRGSIPAELGSMSGMQRLSLAGNSLSGAIPAELVNLPDLRDLYLGRNDLKGRMPPELGGLSRIRKLSLEYNALDGGVPPELSRLTNLEELYLAENQLAGPLPSALGDLINLRVLDLADNDLTGPIPAKLGRLASIRKLSLARNSLTGALPAQLGGLADLTGLYLGGNDLEGPVSPEFGRLARLRELALSGNHRMSGALPASLTNLRSLQVLQVEGTGLCAPADSDFLKWLERLPGRRVATCDTPPGTAYLVQGVQSRRFPVPLLAGEEALLRVFPTAIRANHERLPHIRTSFYIDGAEIHVADIPGKPGPIPTDVDEGSLTQSANAAIPAEVIRPGLEMVVEVDPDGTSDPGLGVTRRIPETGRLVVDVRETPLFDLTVIPFLWAAAPDSAILEQAAGMAADPEGHELLELTRLLLPVRDLRVTAHEPVLSSSNNAYVLLAETRAIRALEGGASHYMGMLSGPATGARGLAARPGRSSFARNEPYTIAHELGHNMNLQHGTSSSCCIDPAYPYPNGTIGVWGYDFRHGDRLVPPTARDLMAGGGSNSWISDYHFSKALRFRLADEEASGAASGAKSMFFWGGVDSLRVPYLEPVFLVDAPPRLPTSDGEYRLAGYTPDGAELFSLSFAMPAVVDGDGSSSFAFVLPVQSGWEGSLGGITLAGPGGSVTLDADSDLPVAILRDQRTGHIRGILRDPLGTEPSFGEAVGALSAESELELDVLFSRGIPDARAWRR